MERSRYDNLISTLAEEVRSFYGSQLVTLALFGSYARNTLRPDSDIDLLIIAKGLPKGRVKRRRAFDTVEDNLNPILEELASEGYHPYFSPVFKTPEEAARRSPLFLDMTVDVDIRYDHGNFFSSILKSFSEKLKRLGARRIEVGAQWYWDLKPGLKAGEVIEL